MQKNHTYQFLDSGKGRKLERFGPYVLDRPCAQAVWQPSLPQRLWDSADASFTRENDNRWSFQKQPLESWTVTAGNIQFKIDPTDFGHLGIFPEQEPFWLWIQDTIAKAKSQGRENIQVLNLFAYSGGSTLAASKAGAHVCHLDASKGMVAWARENAALNDLQDAPIRWIVEDVSKFLVREQKRGKMYDGIILDPPTFGRGTKGEVFKIEEEIIPLLDKCRHLLSPHPLFVLFSCHTPGFTPIVMENLLAQSLKGLKGSVDSGEMSLRNSPDTYPLPSGTFARWTHAEH